MINAIKHNITAYMGGALNYPGPREHSDVTCAKNVIDLCMSEISIFTLFVKNLQFNFDQFNKTKLSEKGLTQHMWMKQYPSKDFRHYLFDYCSQVYKKEP